MNDVKKMNWSELQQWADKANWTPPPIKRKQEAPKVAAEMTDDQKIATVVNKYSDDALASKFIWTARTQLRYVPQRSKWMYWDGHVWKWDEKGQASELVKEYGRGFLPVGEMSKEAKDIALATHKKLTSPKGIKDILTLASTDPMMVVGVEDFDTNIYELNTPAGVVDLYTGKLSPATPESLVRRSTTVAPDANCPTPLYDRLLAEAFAGEPEVSDFLETMIGMSMIKAQDEQVFIYMYGAAGSGKGTLMGLATSILGMGENGYVATVDSSMFVQARSQPHPTEMMQFLGARMAISSEITQGQRMDTGKLKRTTGGDRITGRYMNKDFVTFDATHTLWLMANDRLQVPHDDRGVWRRLRVIDFKHSAKKAIVGLEAQIFEQEAPGILARWIEKAQQYLNEGYYTPEAVITAGETYVAEQDTVTEWIEYCVDTEDAVSSFVSGEALRESYTNWCKREHKTAITARPFTQALEARGFNYTKKYVKQVDGSNKQMRGFIGLALP
jgi:putative DNA primase/helicase